MTTQQDALAAALHGLYVSGPPYECDHDAGPFGDDVPRCVEDAAALTASGWTLAPVVAPGGHADWCRRERDHHGVCDDMGQVFQPAPDPLLSPTNEAYVMALRDHDECCGTLRNHDAATARPEGEPR